MRLVDIKENLYGKTKNVWERINNHLFNGTNTSAVKGYVRKEQYVMFGKKYLMKYVL